MSGKISRRAFVGTAAAGLAAGKGLAQVSSASILGKLTPRGKRRIIYVSDPSSIAISYLPDPTTEKDLRSWVDDLAEARVDTFIQEAYTQGWTTYWRGERHEYDARPQHRRFLPLLNAGVQPLAVLIDQSHRRGIEFLAGVRINDNHGHVSVQQGVGAGARFLTSNPQWLLKEAPPGAYYKLSTPLDFTFAEVRNYVFSVVEEMVRLFDLDGIELCFRDHGYFPPGKGPENQPRMTELVRRVRDLLTQQSTVKKKKLVLGARVYQTLSECRDQGLDVPEWIAGGLLDYVAPNDVIYSDFNAPYDAFTELARAAPDCRMYPAILPWTSVRSRRRLAGQPISLDQQRALAQNFYGAGADGISFYNHMVPNDWAPFYPEMLHDFPELRDPERVARGRRHYVFEPLWAGATGFGPDRTSTGAVKADKIVLERKAPQPGRYRFRICEDIKRVRRASLLFRAFHMTPKDQCAVRINGSAIPADAIRRSNSERRLDMKAPVDPTSRTHAGEPLVPDVPGVFCTFRFELKAPPVLYGDNWLEVALTATDPAAEGRVVIDEIEVLVLP